MILRCDDDTFINTDNVLYYKIVEVPGKPTECVLRAYFVSGSVLITKGARQYLLNAIEEIAKKTDGYIA